MSQKRQLLAIETIRFSTKLRPPPQSTASEARSSYQNELIDVLIAASPMPVLLLDRNGRILKAGRAIGKLLDCEPEKLEEMPPPIQDASGKARFETAFGRVLANETILEFEICLQKSDNTTLEVSLTLAAVVMSSGAVGMVLAFIADKSQQKKMEERLLQGQRLDSIAAMASGFARDLNNILSPILMALTWLRKLSRTPEDAALVAMLETSTRRGMEIVDQWINAGQMTDRKEPLQMEKFMLEVNRIIGETFPNNIHIEHIYQHDLWPVFGSGSQLRQALINLCINARDAMPQGGKLTLKASNVFLNETHRQSNSAAIPGPYVRLSVEDSGCGMPPDVLSHIFDLFYTTKSRGQAVGLGLPAAQHIIKSHRGFIAVQSKTDWGSLFDVYLPAWNDGHVPARLQKAGGMDGHGKCVLVVDDEDVFLQVAGRILTDIGYHVLLAKGGTDGFVMYIQNKADIKVVISDIIMPEMDGFALTRVIRKMNLAVPIILMSGSMEHHASIDPEILGVHAVLKKPFDAEELIQTLETVFFNDPTVNVQKQ